MASNKTFKTKQSDFKCRSEDVLDKNDEQCQRESENLSVKGNLMISKKTNTQSHETNEPTQAAEEISSTSQIEPECNCSKDYKTYKSQLQPIKYFWSNKPVHKENSEPKGTPTLHDSSQDSSQCSNAASLVSAGIDMSDKRHERYLLDKIVPTLKKSHNFGHASLILRKRSNEEFPKPPEMAMADYTGNVVKKAQWSSQIPKLPFEFSDDDEEENFMNGNTKIPTMYSCKHCDYSEVNITHMVSHYDNKHPYVKYKPTYIQDPCDQSATFRCLKCPAEFLSVPELWRHYMENHPDQPGFYTTSTKLHLVYKCFACSYTADELSDLKTHYKEMHPTYRIENTLKYCRYFSSPQLCHSDDMKLRSNDSELPRPEKKKMEEIRKSSSPECPTPTFSPGNDCHKSTKQSACVTSAEPLQIPAHESSESVTCENISDSEHRKQGFRIGDLLQKMDEASDASVAGINPYSCAESLFYCQICNYGSPSPRGVTKHQISRHSNRIVSLERVHKYTLLIREEIKKSKWINASFSQNLPPPILCKNEKRMFFCHLCNHRQRNLQHVLHHCSQSHHGVAVTSKEVERYSSMVLQQRRKTTQRRTRQKVKQSQQKKEALRSKSDLDKNTAAATKQQRSLQCRSCPFNTQLVTDLKKHVLEKHNSKCSSSDILEQCFRQGNIQAGYHCDVCVFSHTRAKAVYKHFQGQHPDQKITLNYVNTQLRAGPKSAPPKKKKSKEAPLTFHTYQVPLEFDTSPRSTEASRCMKGLTRGHGYVCKICSQICATPEELNRHCDEAHARSEASSEVNNKCKSSPEVSSASESDMGKVCNPLKLGLKVSLSNDVNRYMKSASKFQGCFYTCGLCLKFYFTQKLLGEHYVEKHGKEAFFKYCTPLDEGGSEINNLPPSIPDSALSQQNASETCDLSSPAAEKKLVYKCPNCPYVNASNSGTLAHYRIMHPRLVTRRCTFQTDTINVADVKSQRVGTDSFVKGYACGECPQIHVSLKMLRIHCDLEHSHVKPKVSELLKDTGYQPECSQDFVPEAVSSPSANNPEMCPGQGLPKVESDRVECKVCPNLTFDSAQQLISHYNTLHFSDRVSDFIVLPSEESSGLYRCSFCHKQVHGIPQLRHHLDQHKERAEQAVGSADTNVSVVDPPEVKPATQVTVQAHMPVLKTGEDLTQWNVTPGETSGPPSSPIKPTDVEEPEQDPEKDALISKYYVFAEPVETHSQVKEHTDERPIASDKASKTSALDGEAAVTEELLCSEAPDIQQQLNQTSLKAQGHAVSEANWEEGQRGEETLACKDYSFMTLLRKTLKTPFETSHSCQSKPNSLKEFHCPFCPYQTENKNDLIDHIIPHHEERSVPGEVHFPKLSRDLLGSFTGGAADNLRLHMMMQGDIRLYRCRLCYFDCDQLRDLQAHLTDKHQVIRNHELVGELVLDQQEAGVCSVSVWNN